VFLGSAEVGDGGSETVNGTDNEDYEELYPTEYPTEYPDSYEELEPASRRKRSFDSLGCPIAVMRSYRRKIH